MKSPFQPLVITILLIFFASHFIYAQKVEESTTDEKVETKINSVNGVEEVQAPGGKIIFKDGATPLMEIENIGSGGAIILPNIGPAIFVSEYLYNSDLDLWWGDQKITSSNGYGGWKNNPGLWSNEIVGIGGPPSDPTYQLNVYGAVGSGAYFNAPGASNHAGYFDGNVHVTGNITSDGAFPGDNDWAFLGNDIYNSNSGNVGIGTIDPISQLSVGTDGFSNTSVSVKATGGISRGGDFRSDHSVGTGIYGFADNSSGTANTGGIFTANGSDGWGIWATGVSRAGTFEGDVQINGNLTVTGTITAPPSALAKIDHPLDPTNKNLSHSFVESADMMNIYNGNTILDANGEAIVNMADWFEALNMEFRYQLTAIGAPGPNLYISEKINGNKFRIAGGSANMEVSWQVTGIRQDAFANANRVQVEEDKKPEEKGRYIHPTAFGQPENSGVSFREKSARVRESRVN